MGFLDSLGKAFSGKPPVSQQPADILSEPAAVGVPAQSAPKAEPLVRIGRIENNVSGQRLDVYADLRNDSDEPLMMTKMEICDLRRDLGFQLRPGDVQQLLVYSGPLLDDRPNRYAELQYRRVSDNRYFSSQYEIRSDQKDDDGYYVMELLQRGHVRLL